MRRFRAFTLALLAPMLSCRDASVVAMPETALGRYATDWLVAHNRGNAHAIVHFMSAHRGSVMLPPDQADSAVHTGVRFAREVGPLTPVAVVSTSDTLLALVFRSEAGDTVQARFRPAVQPNPAQVLVQLERLPVGRL